MDLTYQSSTQIYVVRACYNDDATDLVAIGGEHSVEVLQIKSTECVPLASFHVGSRITALAWSSQTTSPIAGDDWFLELAAAGTDFSLHLLTKSSSDCENIFPFGGGLSGHHGKINDITFCGGRGDNSARYVATASDDKMLMVWDLHPTVDIASGLSSPVRSPDIMGSPAGGRPHPTAYVIAFPYPLISVNSHPSTSKEFLVSDCRGSIFLTDWCSDPKQGEQENWRHSSLIELVEPSMLSDTSTGLSLQWSGSVDWRRDSVDIVGAVYRSKFSIWDMSKLQGGKPCATGISFPGGGHRFRWCPTYPEYFAISTQSPTKGAVIHVHNFSYVHAQPTVFTIRPRPHLVRDFDFLASPGIPRIAAAVGRDLVIFSIGVDS